LAKQEAEQYQHKSVAAPAERVLTQTWGGQVRLGEFEGIWVYPDECRGTVQRARVLEGPPGVPGTVIVKRINWPDVYDPDDVRPTGARGLAGQEVSANPTLAWRLLCEWTATQFLGRFAGEPPLSPRCYGGDREEGFVLLEDLGEGPRLRELLLGNDPAAAEAALLGYASTLGRLHGATCGREGEYLQLWETLGSPCTPVRQREAESLRKNWRRIEALGSSLRVPWPQGLQTGIEQVLAALRDPGPLLALTQGDYFPANDMVVNGQLRLYDFECAAFRHALFDGFVKPDPPPWRRHHLPAELEQRFETIYRSELIQGCPEASDEEWYARAALEMRMARAVGDTAWYLEMALEQDRHWEGDLTEAERATSPTVRQRTLLVLEGAAAATEQIGHLEALGAAAQCLADRLHSLWQPAPYEFPLFPAFAGKGR
jgi:hypothetical protein